MACTAARTVPHWVGHCMQHLPSLQQLGLLHSCMHDVLCMQWQPLALPEATNCHMLRVDRAPIWWSHAKKCMHAGCTLTQPINKKPNHMH